MKHVIIGESPQDFSEVIVKKLAEQDLGGSVYALKTEKEIPVIIDSLQDHVLDSVVTFIA